MEYSFPTPFEIQKLLPLTATARDCKEKAIEQIKCIHSKKNHHQLLIIGPCSIHNVKGAIEYAKSILSLKKNLKYSFTLLMRVHLEKPRTKNSWRGFVYDPDCNGSYSIEKGIILSRSLLIEILEIGIPLSMEIIDPFLIPYFEDCLSFATIGARTVSSPIHRLIPSGLSIPYGFKNRIDGDIDSAIYALECAKSCQTILKLNLEGKLQKVVTSGNPFGFLILRGGPQGSNFEKEFLFQIEKKLQSKKLSFPILIDCGHGNSQKVSSETVFEITLDEHITDKTPLAGFILESYLQEGNYKEEDLTKAPYDLSVTDSCLSIEKTKHLLEDAQSKLINSNQSLCLNSAIKSPSNVINSAR